MTHFEQLSLKKINVIGNVIGKFSSFCIQQEYRNDTDAVLEVTYTFPISATATVTGFTAKIGEKIIKGRVEEKEKAQKEYEKAMAKGDSAYLMTNQESNIFQMNIGKIAIGETVEIQIDYIDIFDIVDSQIRMMIPTLVPPRYKSETTDKLSYANNEVEYRGNVTIHLDKDLKIEEVDSKTYSIILENNTIRAKGIKLDKDFVLDIKLAEESFSKGYIHSLPNGNQVVYLSFFPDIDIPFTPTPKDYIFVMDISGSMGGYKIEQNKEAVIKCLKQLHKGDRFNIIIFESRYEMYSKELIEFTPENFEKVKQYVQSIQSRGGTELFSALRAAVEQFGDNKIIFLFTDGDVGNEQEIAGYVRQNIGKSALFVFGIDTAVNKKGLLSIADAGRGKAEFIVRDEQIKEIIVRQFARVSSSNLFEISINHKTNKIIDKIEKQNALFNHEFYDVLLEIDTLADDFELLCKTDTQTYSFSIQKESLEKLELPLHKVYASEQIKRVEKYIEARYYDQNKGYKEQIVEIAVAYQIDSKYTAFIAVNERDEKLHDIPVLQDTVLDSPSGWTMRADSSRNYSMGKVCCCLEPSVEYQKKKNRKRAPYTRIETTPINPGKVALDNLLQKTKTCEEMIINKENYQTLLESIIRELLLHYDSLSDKEFKQFIEKMKKETPNVYSLIKTTNPWIGLKI
ncbi:MAG: VWA domain-containing protein [Bacteroidales bacterium]|jgi:Ca-activated chloride channel family protein|nr:VWA domain-containing protein [Bacteroidales bacterium]